MAPSAYWERPAPAAQSHLRCRWRQVVATDGSFTQLVVPDGAADVIVDADDRALLVGPSASAEAVELPAGARLDGIRFRVGAVGSALRIPAGEIHQHTVELDQVVAPRFARLIVDAIRGRRLAWERLDARWDAHDIDPRVRSVLKGYAGGRDSGGWSERQVRRVFHEHAGLAPRAMQRVIRFQRFLQLAEDERSHLGLADLAQVAGYFDQPHLTREVSALTGFAPRELLRRRTGATDSEWPERTRRTYW